MNIVVVGPGAMGCLFAGLAAESLQRGEHSSDETVQLLDRRPDRADAISKTGIRIDSNRSSRVVMVDTCANAASIPHAHLLVLCVKSYDTDEAAKTALPLVDDGTIVLTMQNGAGNGEAIAGHVPAKQIVCGTTSHGATSLGYGHVRHAGTGPTTVAPLIEGNDSIAESVAATLNRAGIETIAVRNAEAMIWNKLLVNAAINPVAAAAGVTNGEILEDVELTGQMHAVAAEVAAVAAATGITLNEDILAQPERVCRATGDNRCSMLQDLDAGRKTEIEFMTGAVVKEAVAAHVNAPVNEKLLTTIRKIEISNRRADQLD